MSQSKLLHILFLTRWYPNCDDVQLGIFVKKHAEAISEFCKVSLVYVHGSKHLQKPFEIEITEQLNFVSHVIYYRKTNFRLINFINYCRYQFLGFKLAQAKSGKIDLIHLHVMYGLGIIARIMGLVKNIPYMVTEHWHGFADGQFEKKNYLFRATLKHVAKNAMALTTISEFLKQKLDEKSISNNSIVIPNVVETITETRKSNSTSISFLTAADLIDRVKNISGVIAVFNEITLENPNLDFIYHIIGGGVDEDKLHSLVNENQRLKEKIIFHGRQNNEYVLRYINQIDFGIVNSDTETFSVFAAELICSGKSLICTRCGGVEEFVNDSNAILIDCRYNMQLKAALLQLIKGKKQFNFESIKTAASEKFSKHAIGRSFFNIYQHVLQKWH